ncbi:MAG: hypothetical protein LC745_05775, partial [Planctomycetia bacterium]|nr:hypothetical protein [Planctomycetia bacterium]
MPLASAVPSRGGDQASAPGPAGPVSFIRDVAPILVQNCIACHNPKKTESKYLMTTFAQLAKGGQQGEGITLEPGDPDASRFVELLRPDGQPRMPYKQDPLPPEKLAVIERWVKEGAKYDGGPTSEDWTAVLRKNTTVVVPEAYPVTVPITALAFSPDGKEVAASGYHEVTLWKADDGGLDRRLRGVAERVYEIAYSPDGKWLATASGDPGQFGAVTLWIAEPSGGGKPVRDLLETTDSVFAVAFSPDGKQLAAAGADRAIRVWEVDSGKQVALIEDHADWILDLAFSPDGKRLASASRDKTCKVFDLAKKESLVTFPGHAQTAFTVAFSPDGKHVASGGEDNTIRLWNANDDGKQVRQITGFGGPVFRVQYTPDGKSLVACGSDKTLQVIDPASGSKKMTLQGHT